MGNLNEHNYTVIDTKIKQKKEPKPLLSHGIT